jgi:hypothetical protein
MSRRIIEGCYARLVGLSDGLVQSNTGRTSSDFKTDYDDILKKLRAAVDDDF